MGFVHTIVAALTSLFATCLAMSWQGLSRNVCRRGGTTGTEVFQPGTAILRIRAEGAGGTVTMPKGNGVGTVTFTIGSATGLFDSAAFDHTNFVMGGPGQTASQLEVTFSNTEAYSIEYRPGPQGE